MAFPRIDRAASLYFFNPLGKMRAKRSDAVPILMYHSISRCAESGVRPYYRTHTSPETFEAHMRYLHENGYAVLGLADVASMLHNGGDGEKLVALTFDDGFRDFYTSAYPVLTKYGFTATVFLPTSSVGRGFKDNACLDWPEISWLRKEGIVFGSHTVTHPQLRQLPRDTVARELTDSRKAIEDKLGEPVTHFSYPYRFPEEDTAFSRSLRALLEEAGYTLGVTTVIGRASRSDDRLFLKRLPVNDSDDLSLFKAKLEGGYDWMRGPQYLFKVLRRSGGSPS